MALTQWRDVSYNVSRFVLLILQYLVFGTLFRGLQRTDYPSVQVWRPSRCSVVYFVYFTLC